MMRGDRTVYVGNVGSEVTDELLHELFLQAGPVDEVTSPGQDGTRKKPFAFVTFKHSCSVPYAINLLDGIKLFDQPIRVAPSRGSDQGNAMFTQCGPPGILPRPPGPPIHSKRPLSDNRNDLRFSMNHRSRHSDSMMPASARPRGRARSPTEKCLDAIPDVLNAFDWLYAAAASQQGPPQNPYQNDYHQDGGDRDRRYHHSRRDDRDSREDRDGRGHHHKSHHSHRNDDRSHRPYSTSHHRKRF
ncbi:Hypothetical protein NTJ_00701 [Nesidiocoris tenuis]|uniref:RRM domain-containing protein n=1 Tax=Nesidiocoris tenuis TaxID=355587 RepID=A0ABN7A6R0_9HEMI|nr:Hypothetical protein NTJ_00701 [Nesidiocoris tenuis]